METFILYRQFAKPPEVRSPKQDTVDLWMELLLQACKPTVSTDRCPVRQHAIVTIYLGLIKNFIYMRNPISLKPIQGRIRKEVKGCVAAL